MLEKLTKLAQELDETGLEEEADSIYAMIKDVDEEGSGAPDALSKDIASNNTINIVRISLFSMGIKELLGFMGVMGAAFSWGKWGGIFKDLWGRLTGAEKEDTADDKIMHTLLEGLEKEDLDRLAEVIQENKELNSVLDQATKEEVMSNSLPEELQDQYDAAIKDVIHDFFAAKNDEIVENVGEGV